MNCSPRGSSVHGIPMPGKPMNREAWWAPVYGVPKSQT